MSTIFPLSPTVGDEYNGYSWDGTSWNLIGNTYSPASYSASAPANPKPGDIWIESDVDVPSISPETILTTTTASSTYQPLVSGVSSTEIGYLDGVTSAIQTQLNAKLTTSNITPLALTQSSNSANYPLTISSANEQGGGAGYSDILKLTNSKAGASNINKHFRISSDGTLEIVNSAYSANIFSITDAGIATSSNLGDTGWISVSSLANSYTGSNVAYRRLNGVVYMRGRVSGGTAGTGVFTLPSGYRPSTSDAVIPVQQYGTADINYVTIGTDGVVVPNGNAAWLSGVCFPVG